MSELFSPNWAPFYGNWTHLFPRQPEAILGRCERERESREGEGERGEREKEGERGTYIPHAVVPPLCRSQMEWKNFFFASSKSCLSEELTRAEDSSVFLTACHNLPLPYPLKYTIWSINVPPVGLPFGDKIIRKHRK